jgi:ABC-type uncharacterized transport system permease subunit
VSRNFQIKKGERLPLELVTTHFAWVLLALASSLRLPLFIREASTGSALQKLSYRFLLCAAFCLSFSLFAKAWVKGLNEPSVYELIFTVFLVWGAVVALRLRVFSLYSFHWISVPLVTLVLAVHLIRDISRNPSSVSNYLVCHIAGAVSGELLAIVAAIIAMLYLGQHRVLKTKHFVDLRSKVPALDLLDEFLIIALGAGFLFLSIALLSGAIFLFQSDSSEMHKWNVKLIWALTVWIWYLLALVLRLVLQVPTKRVAQMSLLGFCFLVVTYFGFLF